MIDLYMEPLGLEEVGAFLKSLTGMSAFYSGVKLSPTERVNSDASNADIMKFLKDSGRDFATLEQSDISEIERAAVDELNKRISAATKRLNAAIKRSVRAAGKAEGFKGKMLTAYVKANFKTGEFSGDEKWTKQTQAAMLKESMKTYMSIVDLNIETQNAAGGLTPLSEAYAEYKRRTFGFETPIGKATGQLLENLDTSIASKNIKLIRKK